VTKVVAQEMGWSYRAEKICQGTCKLIPRSRVGLTHQRTDRRLTLRFHNVCARDGLP
jgi:hypothetical protein